MPHGLLEPAATTTRLAPVKIAAASAIILTRRRPSASLAIGTWATTTVAALASSSSPISGVPMPISFLAYGGTSQLNTPQPTPIIATSMRARRRKGRFLRTSRYPPLGCSGRGASSRTTATRTHTYAR